MNLRLPSRVAACWLALLFLLSQGADALGTHRCRLHDGGAATAEAHAGHHGGGAHGESDGGATDEGPCTCVGDCCASAGGASAPDAAVSWRPVFTTAALSALPARGEVRSLRTPFLLPYSQAPPLIG